MITSDETVTNVIQGRQAAQSKNDIAKQVKTYDPDYVLILLGFNDMGWFVSDAEGTLNTMDAIVHNVRGASSKAKILVGSVVERTKIEGRDDLIAETIRYYSLLQEGVKRWSQELGSVSFVDVTLPYKCTPTSGCSDAYDGLHPNTQGEVHLAAAFADVLRDEYHLLGQNLVLEGVAGRPAPQQPKNIQGKAVPEGALWTWSDVENARGYKIRMTIAGFTFSEGAVYPNAAGYWFPWCQKGMRWNFAVLRRMNTHVLIQM